MYDEFNKLLCQLGRHDYEFNKLLCQLGRHDYEFKMLNGEGVILECFYCEAQKLCRTKSDTT